MSGFVHGAVGSAAWAAAAAVVLALAGCGGDGSAGGGTGGGEDGAGGGDASGGAPQGYQEVDAGWLGYAVPDEWEFEEYEDESEGEYVYESVAEIEGEGEVIMASARVVPIEGVGPETHAQQLAGKFGGDIMIGNKVHDMDEGQEFEVPGATSSARNDYVVEQFRIDYVDEDDVTDVFVVADGGDGPKGAILRLIVSDDHIDESERETIVESLKVT